MPNPTSSFNQSPNHSTLPKQKHPPNTGKAPQYLPQFPSREGDSVAGGRNRTGRAKTSPKTGATGERTGCTDKKGGGKFDPSRCGGHKNSENTATFSELLGQEDKLSPALPGIEHGARPVKDTTETRLTSESGEEDLCRGGRHPSH